MNKFIVLGMALLMSVTSASAKHKKKTRKKKIVKQTQVVPPVAAPSTVNSLRLCASTDMMPAWYLAIEKGFKFPENFQAPAYYRLLNINEARLDSLFRMTAYFKSNQKIMLPLYVDKTLHCKEFSLVRVETMDSALQAKYPQLMTFRAYEEKNQLNAARIEMDGVNTRMMVTYDGKQYYIQSFLHNGQKFYASYAQDDPNFRKEKFER
ncbi:MAG: hypothetical protein JNJ58_10810 [Chitinophagaceae bacterium]|nr:hypothetical protein [Chitinophagaceae bacterium]